MTTYGLVHGAWHSAWHWHLVEAELRRRGHRTVAMDLPCEDPAAGATEYAACVLHALSEVDDDVVLVGHSFGGLTIPVVAEHRPVRGLVFLAALMPVVGMSFDEQIAQVGSGPRILQPGLGVGQIAHPGGASSWRPEAAASTLFPDAPPALAAEAATHLRVQQWRASQEKTPLSAWPDVALAYVLCTRDTAVNPVWSRVAAAERLGVTAIEMPGDHSPFLARPAELVDVLVAAVR